MNRPQAIVIADAARPGRALLMPLACAVILLPLLFSAELFNDGDTSWHIAAGRWMLEAGVIPATDPFSFTFAGRPWVAHEWLSEILMALAHGAAGWAGLAVLSAACFAATLAFIAKAALQRLQPVPAVAATLLPALLLMPFALARPHILSWPLLALWTSLLLDARGRDRRPPLLAAAVMLVWANLHGSYAIGLVLAALFGLEAVLSSADRFKALREWALFGLLCLLAALATSHGAAGLLFPLQVSAMKSLPLIGEWRATDVRAYPLFAVALLGVALAVASGRMRLHPLRLLLLFLLGCMALAHVRHQAPFAIVAPLVLLSALPVRRRTRSGGQPWAVVLVLVLGLCAVTARLVVPQPLPDSRSNPRSAIAAIPPELRGQPVLNSYAFGGPLILAGVRPYIDGRADMYGDPFLFTHRDMMRGDLRIFEREAQRWNVRWTLLSPLDPLSRKLDSHPGWRRTYADRWAVIHVRR
jgi:hypothetical protein